MIWLNNSTENGWEFAMANIKYGNEASLMWHYSHAAILIDIPPRSERGRPPTRSSDRAVFPPSYSRV